MARRRPRRGASAELHERGGERAIGAEILGSLTAGQQVVKIVNEELIGLLSAGDRTFHLSGSPAVVLLVGLQGSGKTTSAAKLARHVVKLGRRPLLVVALGVAVLGLIGIAAMYRGMSVGAVSIVAAIARHRSFSAVRRGTPARGASASPATDRCGARDRRRGPAGL